MVWVRLPVYFYKRNDTFYFSRSIPSDLQHHFKKRKIEVYLRTKSESKASKSAAVLSDRIERYWDSLRMEMIYSRELGMRVVPDDETTIISKSLPSFQQTFSTSCRVCNEPPRSALCLAQSAVRCSRRRAVGSAFCP